MYKTKNILNTLNSQINSKKNIYSNLTLYDSKLMELRIGNKDYSKKVEQKIKDLDELFNKIISFKNSIINNNEKAINEIKESNNKTSKLLILFLFLRLFIIVLNKFF